MSKHNYHKSLEDFFTSILRPSKNGNKNDSERKENVSNSKIDDSVFPKGWFYIKSPINGGVLEPQSLSLNSGVKIVLSTQRFGFDADTQLWRYENGFIINKESGKVLDIKGDRIRKVHGTHLCQNDRKSLQNAGYQRWIGHVDGYISLLSDDRYVLHVGGHFGHEKNEGAYVLVHHKEHNNFIKDELTKIKGDVKNGSRKHKKNGSKDDGKNGCLTMFGSENSKQRWQFESEHEKPVLISPPIPKDYNYNDYIDAGNKVNGIAIQQ
ncbi:17469_t:CDS:2 [Acaulospora morrowiae]|uniref:17469_t:CDS:1 n=1 Tax=Acaulospora morrowiae TaxID=94023 RepID=A0A9N8Z3C3_9GLOM|nr:17469_t:CDS:2 [Acaulospora morrowiae]